MRAELTSKDEYFNEAWTHINAADRIESRWGNRGAVLFVVAFTGAHDFVELGGMLTGEQYNKLRDMVTTTYALKLRDNRLFGARDAVQEITMP